MFISRHKKLQTSKSSRLWMVAIVGLVLALCIAPVSAQSDNGPVTDIGVQLVAEGFTAPVDLTPAPDDTGRLFVVDQIGVIKIIDSDGNLMDTPFLDIQDRLVNIDSSYDERGLLGLAFHPDFANNGRFFVYYSAPLRDGGPADWTNTNHVSEFHVSQDNPNVADPNSETVLLQIDEPQSNHNGGDIAFGPDGYLYIPLGDGGGADDAGMGHTEGMGNGQDLTKMLGKILRIDVDNGDPYSIPADNPYVGNDQNIPEEIWASGFRNPWRMSFDSGGDNHLFVAVAGQNLWEFVHIVTGGNNYGWNTLEGSHCFSVEHPNYSPLSCSMTDSNGNDLQLPIIEYSHLEGEVIIGGYVYRGSAIPGLQGKYFFGEWSPGPDAGYISGFGGNGRGNVYTASPPPGDVTQNSWKPQHMRIVNNGETNLDLGAFLLAFGQDNDGELYLLTSNTLGPDGTTGKVWKIVPASGM